MKLTDLFNGQWPDTILFDLDGTLIKGIRHGWTMVWNILKGPGDTELQEKQKRRKKRFQEGEISYLDWCREDGESCRELGLTRDHFKKLGGINHVSLTKNLREGLRKLRERGIKTAIISGGIDALLYELLPDADDLFDDILINQFIFSEDGIFEYISATEYDWDDSKVGVVGKRRGLERLCEKHGVAISDSAFVGDDLNDIEAMRAAGLKIFYCGDTREFRDSKNTALPRNISIIPSNDFMRVVERILSKKAIDEV